MKKQVATVVPFAVAVMVAVTRRVRRAVRRPRPHRRPRHSRCPRQDWYSGFRAGRSVVRSTHGMVASSQPLASQIGLEVLKRGGNAADAAIAMAAALNVTEPNMTGIGGDAFAMVYWSKTKTLEALNSTGRAPHALTLDYFSSKNMTRMPTTGMASITVPGPWRPGPRSWTNTAR